LRHEIVLRRAQVSVPCQCPCRAPDRATHEGCLEEIHPGGLLIEHIDERGNTSRRCEICGAVADDD
jgi:hypothetical protein